MWRLPGLLSRALHRLHVLNTSSSIHGIPALPSNEELRNATSVLSVEQTLSGQSYLLLPGWQTRWGRDGWEQGNVQRPSLNLQPHYTVLDAFTWGSLAVLALQLARQIPWLSPVPGAGREDGYPHMGRLLTSLLPHQRSGRIPDTAPENPSLDIPSGQREHQLCPETVILYAVNHHCNLPMPPSAHPQELLLLFRRGCMDASKEGRHLPRRHVGLERRVLAAELPHPHSQTPPSVRVMARGWEHPFPESCSTHLGLAHCSAQGLSFSTLQGKPAQQERLEEAATKLQQVFRVSVSIALNILGIESVTVGQYRAAFSFFKLAADRGYSKAQFNVGLCYEHGRGTEKDLAKAALYYHLAASNEHPMAQYRYARILLRYEPKTEGADVQKAVALLEQAAAAGLVEAQAYLGVLYMKGLQSAKQRALKYLWLAAKNGDSQSRYHVGVCYEKGLGVQQNFAEAMKHYQHSAAAGNRHAQERVQVVEQEMAGTAASEIQGKRDMPKTRAALLCVGKLLLPEARAPLRGSPGHQRPGPH